MQTYQKNITNGKRNGLMIHTLKNIRQIFARRFDDAYFNAAVSVAASMCNFETFSAYKCRHYGQSIALCGAGPSLSQYKPIEGAIHIALNRALMRKEIKFDYFIADDWEGIRFFQDTLLKYPCEKFFGHQIGCEYIRQIPESFRIDSNAKRYYTDSYMLGGHKSRFICDIDKMAIGNFPNIALSAMQIVLFMRPSKIYLVGCDASSNGHFFNKSPDEPQMLKKEMQQFLSADQTIQKWLELKSFIGAFYPDIEVSSINPVGLKGIFQDIYQ